MNQLRNFYFRVRELLIGFFLLPFVGGITTVLGIVAGYLGSRFDDAIYDSLFRIYYPTLLIDPQATSVKIFDFDATVFWLLVAICGTCFTGTFWAQNVSSKRTTHEMHAALKQLFTLPPKGFLGRYQQLMSLSNRVEKSLPSPCQLTDLDVAIRIQLDTICAVCVAFDNQRLAPVYGANVMRFVKSGTADFLARQAVLQQETRCIEAGVSIANLAGVLQLHLPWSVNSASVKSPDATLRPLSLPVPVARQGEPDELDYVPGAPLAFALGKTRIYQTQSQLVGIVDGNRRFSSHVLADLEQVLGAQKTTVQCLMCIPLFTNPVTGPRERIGVINIHKNQADLQIEEKFETLGPMLAPFVENLENLVAIAP